MDSVEEILAGSGIGTLLQAVGNQLKERGVDVGSISIGSDTSSMEWYKNKVLKLLSQDYYSASDIDKIIEDSEIFTNFKVRLYKLLPRFITEDNFLKSLCSLKIYNRVKYKEMLVTYADDPSLNISNGLKKKEENHLASYALLLFGIIDSLENKSDNIKYETCLEFRFIQFGLNNIGLKCPNKYNMFLSFCSGLDELEPSTRQLIDLIKRNQSPDVVSSEVDKDILPIIDCIFKFLKQTSPEDLTVEEKNGIIAFMAGYRALFQVNLHYLYSCSYGHDWLLAHTGFCSVEIEKDGTIITNENYELIHRQVTELAFNDNHELQNYIIKSSEITLGVMEFFNVKKADIVILTSLLAINCAPLLGDIIDASKERDLLLKLNNKSSKEEFLKLSESLILNISTLLSCELNNDDCKEMLSTLLSDFDDISKNLGAICDLQNLTDNYKHYKELADFTCNEVRIYQESIGSLKEEIEGYLATLNTGKVQESISRIESLKTDYCHDIDKLFVHGKELVTLANESTVQNDNTGNNELTDLADENATLKDELEKTKTELETWYRESEISENTLKTSNDKLAAENQSLKEIMKGLNSELKISDAFNKVFFSRPTKPTILDIKAVIQEQFPFVKFADNINKPIENCIFENTAKLTDYLFRICDSYYPQIISGKPDSVAKTCLGTVYYPQESEMVNSSKKNRALRDFVFDGEVITINKHITLGSKHDKRATIQVFFDIRGNQLLIGYIGEHLSK